jgi:hypothetical protein
LLQHPWNYQQAQLLHQKSMHNALDQEFPGSLDVPEHNFSLMVEPVSQQEAGVSDKFQLQYCHHGDLQ